MTRHIPVALLATLLSATAWGQEVSLYGTTMAQMWKQEIPGFDKATYTPATQYLGIDATKLGSDNLSLHLFGWGVKDLGDSPSLYNGSTSGGYSAGYLSFGYLQYRFDQANAEIKAGRFTVNQSTGFEQVDGVSARTDLRGGFSISAFGGKPVLYNTVDPTVAQTNYDFQHDFIFGSRLAWRLPQITEIGISYLQDGSKPAQDLTHPEPVDYTRKQVGLDLLVTPTSTLDLRGRTVFDVAKQPEAGTGTPDHNNIAEHDYTLTWKLGSQVAVSGNYAERNFNAYFAGTNLPSLFRQDDNDMFRGWGGKVTWTTNAALQVVADYRHTHRESVGDANRAGGELRWSFNDKAVLFGLGGHWVNAADTKFVDPTAPGRSLSNKEARAWVLATKGRFTASLDGILQRFDSGNPYLAGVRNLYEVVGSLGYQASSNVKVSGDVSYGSTLVAVHETRGLLKAEYRFGFAKKGGQ
jgi:hypothetical protein